MSKMQKVYILKAAAWTMTMSMADVFEMHSGDDLTPPPPKYPHPPAPQSKEKQFCHISLSIANICY